MAHREIETGHPGYLGSPDTFKFGTVKGVSDLPADLRGYLQQDGLGRALHDRRRSPWLTR